MSELPAAADRKKREWVRFVELSGEEGRQWLEAYGSYQAVEELSTRSLELLRQRRHEDGYEVLLEAERRFRALNESAPSSVKQILGRWFFGVEAYYFYCIGELERAEEGMRRAHRAVAKALGEARFLLPFAYHCQEFRLHRARIARNRRRWQELREHIVVARGMVEGSEAFCTLDDGTAIHLATLRSFYDALQVAEQDADTLTPLYDDALRLGLFDRFVERLSILPGFIIPYP